MLGATRVAVLLAAVSTPAFSSVLLQGTFSQDDDVADLPFTISAGDVVTIQSYGYAGGVTPGAITIPEGGFAPVAFLFDGSGSEIATLTSSCPPASFDSITGNCDDIYYNSFLSAGSYTLALAVDDNAPNDGFLADGFKQDGNPGFTCMETGGSGPFCDVSTALGTARNGDYAVYIAAPDLVAPEPSTLLLMGGGVVLLALRRRKRA